MSEYKAYIKQIEELKQYINKEGISYTYIWGELFDIIKHIQAKLEWHKVFNNSLNINEFYNYCDKALLELEYLDINDVCVFLQKHENNLIQYLKNTDRFILNQMF